MPSPGHTGPLVPADPAWLLAQGVQEWSGPRVAAALARRPGLARASPTTTAARPGPPASSVRPLAETLADTLAWELAQDPDRPRGAGLTPDEERALLALLA